MGGMPVAERQVIVEHVMGTVASLDIRGGRLDGLDAAIHPLHDADARFSTYRPESEIRRIEAGTLRRADASQDVQAVLARCARLRDQTGGYFDARAGGRLD